MSMVLCMSINGIIFKFIYVNLNNNIKEVTCPITLTWQLICLCSRPYPLADIFYKVSVSVWSHLKIFIPTFDSSYFLCDLYSCLLLHLILLELLWFHIQKHLRSQIIYNAWWLLWFFCCSLRIYEMGRYLTSPEDVRSELALNKLLLKTPL